MLEVIPVGALQVNCYLLRCDRTLEAVVIDPGDEPDLLITALGRAQARLTHILATHGHFDHLLACRALRERTGAPFYVHRADRPLVAAMQRTCMAWLGSDPGQPPEVDGDQVPGDTIRFGDVRLEIRHTPGHSPGGVTLVDHAGRRAFTGDALFAGSIGRADLAGGDLRVLLEGIRSQILSLSDDYVVLSGHGPATTVGSERRSNPYLSGSTPHAW